MAGTAAAPAGLCGAVDKTPDYCLGGQGFDSLEAFLLLKSENLFKNWKKNQKNGENSNK
jgi:hypothetical protein